MNKFVPLNNEQLLLLCASSLQIAGAYPLTQVYQHTEDKKSGVRTISMFMGIKGTFIFSISMFLFCNLVYYFYFLSAQTLNSFFILQLFFLPILIYFVMWFVKVLQNTKNADFKHSMRMNLIASVCMTTCFLTLFLINRP
jgi:1,4-dihydroxy-2-naphthoate octaprenyltransferase